MAQTPNAAIVYPESDGKPMADNTRQARWIMVLHGNLEALLRDVLAFVAANLMWYAREGFPEECEAPDVFVAFGRPAGERRSYKQWEEADVAPQVVFEILSPSNTPEEMEKKDAFYSDHGVEEYYVYNPEKDDLSVYLRQGTVLRRRWVQNEFVSPRLGIRFDLTGPEMQVFYPDGRRFLTFKELEAERARQAQLRVAAEEKLHSTEEKLRRMAELGRKARLGQATPEDVAELERLENETL
jgi:Uma2 family endonuclease